MTRWFICTMEIQLLRKMKFMDKWLELETIILSETTQTQQDKRHMVVVLYGSYLHI